MIKDYFKLAYKSARQRRMRSWLTMIGIFIGIAAVVALMSLSQGLQTAIAEQFVSLGSDKVIVQAAGSGFGPPGTGAEVPLTISDREVMEKVSGVDNTVGRLLRAVKIEFNEEIKYPFVINYRVKKGWQETAGWDTDGKIGIRNALEIITQNGFVGDIGITSLKTHKAYIYSEQRLPTLIARLKESQEADEKTWARKRSIEKLEYELGKIKEQLNKLKVEE